MTSDDPTDLSLNILKTRQKFRTTFSGLIILEMWANVQRDGRPAKHRWRPLFNAAKFD